MAGLDCYHFANLEMVRGKKSVADRLWIAYMSLALNDV
jgi:hypothetical protein